MSLKEPSDGELRRSIKIALGLICLAILAPILSLIAPYPHLSGVDLGGWFSRSGAVTTVFALLAETVLVRARLSITPSGFGWVGLNELRQKFLPWFNKSDLVIFFLVITGTLVWAYGDLPFKGFASPAGVIH
ncbi:efflux RND transporter permease subunit [Pseudomonas sp. JV449]|uniref:hypothetical protein n=1 Tax=Pseudomonas sp. JV449 TaxID=1890658 RepID=UPI0028E0B1C8|nr:hypothetical protein [Pseudomonas sp. JV449]MDT9633207.1 efflux RND transporter permease subunit [Pseudomonas sp. JV449]